MSYGLSNIYEILGEEGEEGKTKPQKRVESETKPPQKEARQSTQSAGNKKNERAGGNRPERENRKVNRSAEGPIEEKEQKVQRRKNDREKPAEKAAERNERGKRNFERRSGSGRGRENKKGGFGKGNWGAVEDTPVNSTEEERAREEKQPSVEGEVEAEKPAEVEVEETKTEEQEPQRTLDEYYQSLSKTPVVELGHQIRMPGEGEDESKWKSFVPLSAKPNEEETILFSSAKVKEKATPLTTKEGKEKKVVQLTEVLKVRDTHRDRRFPRDSSPRNAPPRNSPQQRKRGGPPRKRGGASPSFDASSFPPLG